MIKNITFSYYNYKLSFPHLIENRFDEIGSCNDIYIVSSPIELVHVNKTDLRIKFS